MKLDVNFEKIDKNLMYKRFKISVGDKKAVTPIKASSKTNPVSPINEIYRTYDLEKIDKCINDNSFEVKVNSDIERDQTTGLNVFIVDYADTRIPNKNNKQLELLSDIQYPHTDIITTPTMSKIYLEYDGDKLLSTFTDITNRYIEVVKTLNDKTIIGTIPAKMPRQFLESILKNYHDKDITSFMIDFDGRSIDTNPSWVRLLMRMLKVYGLIEEAVLYSVNATEGKFMKKATEIPAKDFVSCGFGIDILGLKHIRPKMPSDAWARIKNQPKSYRLFNRGSYGYIKKTEQEIRNLNLSDADEVKKFNVTEQHKETLVIHAKMKDEDTIEHYIKTKSLVDEGTIKKMKKLRNETLRTGSVLDY